ncbi:MAG: metal-dependent hydrolase [Planctomycetota bacterium]
MPALRVVTFNLRGSFVNDGANVWPARAELNVATLKKLDPDLVGFQEVQTGNLDHYARGWNAHRIERGPHYNNRDPFCYTSAAWRPGAVEVLDSKAFWLSETPDCHSASWDTNCIRSALALKLRLAGGLEGWHLNTHLDHMSQWARIEGAKLIVKKLAELSPGAGFTLITGDFNTDPGEEPYEVFRAAGYRDAHVETGQPDGPEIYTFHGFTGTRLNKPHHGRIDWILYKDGTARVRAKTCHIVRDAEPPLYPSDHYPVLAELEIEG